MDKTLLFGTSYMGEEYLKVLRGLNKEFVVIGRDEVKAKILATKYSGIGLGYGIDNIKNLNPDDFSLVIIASAIESLKEITIACLNKGFTKILVEKPGALSLKELEEIKNAAIGDQKVLIAYNRRYHASTLKMKEILTEEEIQGSFFDFTDREKDIVNANKSELVKNKWGLANSSHVIDMAFSLIGSPEEINCDISGSMVEHPSGSTFVGSGKSNKSLFSYFATWNGGGRWNVEISTIEGRYKMSPLEKLSFCKKNQFAWVDVELNDKDDTNFKPGLKKMVKSVLDEKNILLPNIKDQLEFSKVINKIFGYKD